jgi:TPP-dependent pyruvate/acetoin dehydrogenase alpha subunit
MTKSNTKELEAKKRALLKEFGQQQAREMLQTMLDIRTFEEKAEELYMLGKTHGTMHLSIGQEGCAIGASYALRRGEDFMLNHHRGHGHTLAWGGTLNLMMAEFLGRETGYCRGRGGSMHIAEVERNNLGANGIVAGGLPIAAGVGISIKLRKTDQVCIVLFGDGAANEGAFHESLNMASIWDLPVIYFCENNQYAMSMAMNKAFNVEHISERACAYNIPGELVDGNDVFEVYDAVRRAANRARKGEGPTLLESLTYRWKGHSRSDRQAYRTREEVKEWQQKDPILRFTDALIAAGMLEKDGLQAMRDLAHEHIEAALEFAEASPEPELSTILDGLYA